MHDDLGSSYASLYSPRAYQILLGGSSLLVIVVPLTTAIVEHSEKARELAIKDKELEQTITLQCLTLAVSKDTSPNDRRKVLQAIVNFNTPLKQWAVDGIAAIDRESEAEQKKTQLVQTSFDSRGSAPVELVVLQNKDIFLQQRISQESQNGDSKAADADLEELLNVKAREVVFKSVPEGAVSSYANANRAALAASDFRPVPIKESNVTDEIVEKIFPSTPLANIQANLPLVLGALKQFGILDRTMLLIALSTIRTDAESFEPLAEEQSLFNTSPGGKPFDLYDNRRGLGNIGPPDGARFRGRGYIQITGRANYERVSAQLGLGTALVDAPEKASDPKIAAQLLALFLEQREVPLQQAASNNDLARMRRLFNGGSNGLDRFTSAYQLGDKLLPK